MKNPTSRISQRVSQDVTFNRFASYDGAYPLDGGLARGVYEFDQLNGKGATLITEGVAEITLSASVTVGQEVASDATGQGRMSIAGEYVNGVALKAGSAGDTIPVDLRTYKV